MADLRITAGEWVKPTTRTPPRGEIVLVKSKGGGYTSLGYFTGTGWLVSAAGTVGLDGVSEWAPATVAHDSGVAAARHQTFPPSDADARGEMESKGENASE